MIDALSSLRRVAQVLGPDARAAKRLRGYIDTLDRAPEARRPAIAQAVAEVEPALADLLAPGDTRDELAAAVPYRISAALAARLVLGARPVDLAPGLSRAEAHAWLSAGAVDTPAGWLCRQSGAPAVSTVPVARWLIAAMRQPAQRAALERQRREVLAGQAVEGRYLDRVDELRSADLRGGVEDTFRAAAQRLTRALERELKSRGGEPLAPDPRWWRPAKCARLLRTGPDLVAEGRALEHCVATYATAVRDRRSVIVGLCVLGQRSTVEIDPSTVTVRQHKGRGNATPPPLCERALKTMLARWRAAA